MQYDWVTFALEIINFLVLVWILKRFFYQPVLAMLDARQARIRDEMAKAGQAQREGEALKLQYDQRLAHWQQEREQLRQQLERELAQQRASGVERIRQTLADEEAKARARSAVAAASREADLIRQASSTAYGKVAALLQRLASPALTASIASLLLEDLDGLPQEQRDLLSAAARKVAAGSSVEIAAAHPLEEAARRGIVAALSAATGQPLHDEVKVDPTLIAGIRVAVGDCLLHANLADELAFFRRQDGND